MEDECEMCGQHGNVVFVAGVGLICKECDKTEFGPFDDYEDDYRPGNGGR